MTKKSVKARQPLLKQQKYLSLTPDQIETFYKVLFICESEIINSPELKTENKNLKPFFINCKNIDLENNDNANKMRLIWSKKYDELKFCKNVNINEIIFLYEENVVKSLLKHLRNAYAHNRIEISNEYLLIEDFSTRSNRTTLIGRIKYSILTNFLECIFQTCSINNKNS